MNQLLDDETVIARLRSALDELTAPDDFATPGDELPMRPQRTMTPAAVDGSRRSDGAGDRCGRRGAR